MRIFELKKKEHIWSLINEIKQLNHHSFWNSFIFIFNLMMILKFGNMNNCVLQSNVLLPLQSILCQLKNKMRDFLSFFHNLLNKKLFLFFFFLFDYEKKK